MIIKSSKYIISNLDIEKLPKPTLPEYAFIGRSNVGKSSLINMLTNNKHLAKVSKTPGKTQLINHFLINDNWYLVDLPGYGFAKASKKMKHDWKHFIKEYLSRRTNLQCVFALIDSRLSPQNIDIEFINWLGKMKIPFVITFTKADKQKKDIVENNVTALKKTLMKYWQTLPEIFITSAVTALGKKEILEFINSINEQFKKP